MSIYTDAHTHRICDNTQSISVFNAGISVCEASVLSSAGIHPWEIKVDEFIPAIETLRKILDSSPRIIAIGECGLDALFPAVGIHDQMRFFEAQLIEAQFRNMPVIVHCVKAYPQLLLLLKKLSFALPVILHSPRVNSQQICLLGDFDVYYSVGPLSIHWEHVSEMIQQIPTSRLLCETDDADLSISDVFQQVAAMRNCSVEELNSSVYSNFTKAFNYNGKR